MVLGVGRPEEAGEEVSSTLGGGRGEQGSRRGPYCTTSGASGTGGQLGFNFGAQGELGEEEEIKGQRDTRAGPCIPPGARAPRGRDARVLLFEPQFPRGPGQGLARGRGRGGVRSLWPPQCVNFCNDSGSLRLIAWASAVVRGYTSFNKLFMERVPGPVLRASFIHARMRDMSHSFIHSFTHSFLYSCAWCLAGEGGRFLC